jgi:hypothetical protein
MEDIFKTNEGDREAEIKRLESEYNKKMEIMDKAVEKLVLGELDKDGYNRLKEKLSIECTELRLKINDLKKAESGFNVYLNYGISLLSNLPYYYSNATLEGKQKMLGLIFPEKLIFDKGNYRTKEKNEILDLLCNKERFLKEIKKDKKLKITTCPIW